MLQYLPLLFCMLVCPVGMGLMMWMGKRTDQGSSRPAPSRAAKEPQPLATAERSQERETPERSQEHQTPEDPSPMSMIGSCMKHCLNWKVLAGLVAVALGIGVVAPHWFSLALPTLLVLICPLSMRLMPIPMGFSRCNRRQNTASCCTQNAVPSS